MKKYLLVLLFLLGGIGAANAQASVILNCFNSLAVPNNVQTCPGNKNTTNASITIATGNTFQQALAAASNRASLTIENNNASDSCWIYIGASGSATKALSILLIAGGSYQRYFPFVPADAIQATCASNSDTLYVDYQ